MLTFKPSAIVRGKQRRAGRRFLTVAFLLAVLPVASAQASPGMLDPSFGSGGEVTTAIGLNDAKASALVRQPDGKLVTAGTSYNATLTGYDFALARYNPDGSLDTSFNGTGKVTTAIGPGFAFDYAQALVLQPDGKLVAAGFSGNPSNYDFALARYNPDGSPDTTFNGTGKVTTPIGPGNDFAYALALQPDGKLVVAGKSYTGSNYDFALARYNADGSLDTSFNGTGKVTTAIGQFDDDSYALALQPDGKLVATGSSYTGSQDEFALVRYNPDGSLDASFNGTGKVTTAIGSFQDDANALALEPDGKLVAAGASYTGANYDFALARYNPDGSLDTSFNGTGKVTSAIGSGTDVAIALVLQPDGKPVTAGYSYNGPQRVFALARYNPDGSLDPTFGSSGTVTTAIGSVDDQSYGLALQPDGKLVAAGFSYDGVKYVSVLVRYLGGTLSVPASGSGSGWITSSPMSANQSATATFSAVCVVPKVKGKTLATAKKAIKRAHCRVGKVTTVFSAKVKKGHVIAQKRKAGNKLSAGAKVTLTVSKGRKAVAP